MITVHKALKYTAIYAEGYSYVVNTGYITVEQTAKYILPKDAEVRYVGEYLTMYTSNGATYSGIALEAADLLARLKKHSGTNVAELIEKALALC